MHQGNNYNDPTMKKLLLLAAAAIAIHANAQINFGDAPQIKKEVKPVVYDGKHNIDLQNNNGDYNLAHLIGQTVTYLGINDKTEFYTNDPSSRKLRRILLAIQRSGCIFYEVEVLPYRGCRS